MAEMSKKFVIDRKDYLMSKIPYDFPLDSIVNFLNLDFQQAKRIFQVRFSDLKTQGLHIHLTQDLVKKDLKVMFELQGGELNKGNFMNFEVNSCCKCQTYLFSNFAIRPSVLFSCGHFFHRDCLDDLKCTVCTQINFFLKKRSEQVAVSSRMTMARIRVQAQTEQQKQKQVPVKNQETLFTSLEKFDQQQGESFQF